MVPVTAPLEVPSTGSAPSAGFRATVGLRWLAGFGAFGLAVSVAYARTGLGAPCPFRLATGWDCPLCGGTRLGNALLHGDVVAAFHYNALVLVGLGVLGMLGLLWTVEALGGPAMRLPARWAERLSRLRPNAWLLLGGVVAAAWTVARNLL